MRATSINPYTDQKRRLLTDAGLAALAAGMALGLAPASRAQTVITGPAGGPIAWTSGDFTITASGDIGAASVGVAASGSLGNFANHGQINVTQTALDIAGGAAVSSIANDGSMQSGGSAVNLGSGASVSALSNLAGGTLHGTQSGIVNSGGLGWLSNAGLIAGDTTFGVANGGNLGVLQNQAGGTIRSDGSGGAAAVYDSGALTTFSNSGQILAPNAYAVIVTGGSLTHLSNETGGVINSANAAVWNNGQIGDLSNGGRLTSVSDAAVRNFASIGTLTNWGALGGPSAIVNSGTIGAIANSGDIEAGNVAIDNQGSIQTLTNAAGGTIIANYAVRIDGQVGTLTNAGTITAASRAILVDSTGSLGQISNSGTIQGYVENATTHDLLIAGGSGSVYGTLTGYSNGGQAAILNGSSDLYLSGNLVLDDTVFLGGHTLYSSGNLQLSRSVSVTGNFAQNGGGLMFAVASPSSYAQLNFTGASQVSIANASVGLLPASNGILAQGQSYTVVQAPSGAIVINNDTVQVAGFNGVLTNTGHALVLSLLPPTPTDPGGSGGAASGGGSSGGSGSGFPSGGGSSGAGGAIDTLGSGSTPVAQAFNSVITPLLVGLSPTDQAKALVQLSPSTLALEVSLDAASPVSDAIAGQQEGYVAQDQGRAYAALGDTLYGGGLQSPSRGLWGKVLGGGAGGDAGGGAPFSADLVGAVVGGDLVRTEQVDAGLAASWVGTWARGKGATSSTSLHFNSYQITAYGSAAPRAFGGRLSIDAQLGAGFNRYDQERGVDFLHSAARAGFNGEQYTGRLTAGYAFIGRTMTVTPYAGVEETHIVLHGYAENGAGLADLQVHGVTADTFRHDIGVKLEGAYDVGAGVTMTPGLKLGWGHTYDNGPVAVYGALAGVAFSSPATRPDPDGALVGASLSFRRPGRLSLGFEYQGDLRRDFQAHTGAVRLRVRF